MKIVTVLSNGSPPRTAFGRLLRGANRVASIPQFEEFAGKDWASRVMADSAPEQLHAKQGRTISLWSVSAADGRTLRMYLKRHYVLPRWHGLFACLLPSCAWSPGLSEWEHLRWAEQHGIAVARPIAAGEFLAAGGRLQSFLAVEELAGELPLHEAIPLAFRTLSPTEFSRWKRALIRELARLTRELHGRKFFHKDLYLCHFYLPSTDCASVPESFFGRVHTIDFHRLARHRITGIWFQIKDLAQLLFSTNGVAGVTNRDCVRFWKLYREGEWHGTAPPREWVRSGVLRKWKLYLRHNEKHRKPPEGKP